MEWGSCPLAGGAEAAISWGSLLKENVNSQTQSIRREKFHSAIDLQGFFILILPFPR